MINDDMILGLRFLQHSLQTTIIHEGGITFVPYLDNVPYISEIQRQRKALQYLEISDPDNENNHSLKISEINDDVELSANLEEYHVQNTCIECIGLQSFAPN
jgi:hypothetical protein